MKDSTSKNISTTTYTLSSNSVDSIRKDLKGIRCEICHYRKEQKENKSDVSSDTVFTVFVTISVFVIGIIIDRLLKWYDRSRKEEELRKFFEYHLNRANEHFVPKLKDAYLNYSETRTIDTGITSTPPKIISSDFQRLIHTKFEELFKAYMSKEVLSKVLSNIELVDKVQIEVNNFHDRVYADSGLVRDELETLADEYMSLLSKYQRHEIANNPQRDNSETYKLIVESIKTYYTELAGTRELSKFYQDIVRKIQDKIVETKEYQTHDVLKDVAEKGRKLSHVVSKLKQKTKEITDQYKVFADHMNEANKSLNSLIKQLK